MKALDPTTVQLDTDLMASRLAFPEAQAAFEAAVASLAAASASVAWHGTELHPETGSVVLVREDGPYVDLVGELVKVSRTMATQTRVVYAYVFATAAIATDFSLARRTFMGLGILANEELSCRVEILA